MQGHKNVLGIMPTGSGKSLTFMLLARCSPSGVTIVVILLTALEGDIVRRCKESDIKRVRPVSDRRVLRRIRFQAEDSRKRRIATRDFRVI
ncbi:unnamed protein product, partial [Aureobasidium pullulans]